jgi:hypothetical protein
MDIFYSVETQEFAGPKIQFSCPKCSKYSGDAETFETTEKVKLFYVIPILKLSNSIVKCAHCRSSFRLTKSAFAVPRNSADEAAQYVAKGGGFFGALMVGLALFFFWIPMVSIVMAIAAFLFNRNGGKTRKVLCWIALVLSVIVSILTITSIVTGK